MPRRRRLLALLAACLAAALMAVLPVAVALLRNAPALFDPPGFALRLRTHLSTNVARLAPGSPFPELAPAWFDRPPDEVLAALGEAARTLGWEAVGVVPGRGIFGAVVVSPLLGFRDDVELRVDPAAGHGTVVTGYARSRVGVGDLGANAAHLVAIVATTRALLAASRPAGAPLDPVGGPPGPAFTAPGTPVDVPD